MRLTDHSTPPYSAHRPTASASFGRVVRTQPLALSAEKAPAPASTASAPHDAVALHSLARAIRARRLGDALAAAMHTVVRALRVAAGNWERAEQRRATVRALRELDDRTLRDLGVHRSELTSVAYDLERNEPTARLRAGSAANALRLF